MARKKVDPGLAPKFSTPTLPDYVVAEMRYDSRVAVSAAGFEGPAEAEGSVGVTEQGPGGLRH